MFGITGKMSGTDWRNTYNGAPSVNNIFIFTNNNTDLNSSWLTINQGNGKFIRARDHNFADVGVPSNVTSIDFIFNTGTTGSHVAENYGAYATPYENYGNSGGGVISGSSGSHNHGSFTINFTSNNFSLYRIAYMRKRNPSSSPYFTLPIGTILFGENLDNVLGVSGYSSYSNRYLMGGEGVSFGGSSNPISISVLTNSSGDHLHNPSPYGGSAVTGVVGNFAETDRAFTDVNAGTVHQHTVIADFNIRNKYVKLRTYVTTNSNVIISRGMIFGFVSNVYDPDWVCCNGQTVRGYTTPNLVDRFIMCGDSTLASHNVTPSYTNDVNTVTYLSSTMDTNAWSHSHGVQNPYPASTSLGNLATIRRYHSTASVSHSHSTPSSTAFNTFDFEPTHFNLIFYMYLP
jgi:hypothetical protein